jgi:LCP family protein required for cell wall assembly
MPKTRKQPKRRIAQTNGPTKVSIIAPPPDRHFFDWRFFTTLIVLVGLSLSFAGFSRVIDPTKNDPAVGSRTLSIFEHIGRLVENQDQPLRGETSDRINILLLGIGGAGHDGAYLADTIILVSLKPSTGQLAMLSIPRDFYVPIPGYDHRKINNANAFGRQDNYPGGGEQLTADILSQILQIDIAYYARADFVGFKKLIDDLGGVTVDVEKSFVDTQYPTENYGYQTISFKAGTQAMNGDTALKFVRSRKSTSDFDRSKRQQQVLVAVRQKALSFGTLLNPVRISDVLSDLGAHTKTNLELWEMIRLAGFIEELDTDTIINRVLDSGKDSPLMADTTLDGAYILRPKAGWDDWTDLRTISDELFDTSTRPTEIQTSLIIQNGTTEVGLAEKVSAVLKKSDYTVLDVTNAKTRNQPVTQIFDLTSGAKPDQLRSLRSLMPKAELVSRLPVYLTPDALAAVDLGEPMGQVKFSPSEGRPDFIIVLGSDGVGRALLTPARSTKTKKAPL